MSKRARSSRSAKATPAQKAELEKARARLKVYLDALRAAGHKVRTTRSAHLKGSTVACRFSVDGFGVAAQYSDFGDRWVTESRAVSEVWLEVTAGTGKAKAAKPKAKDVARRKKMLREDVAREKRMKSLRAKRLREWNKTVDKAKKELPKYVKGLRKAGYRVKVFLDHKRGGGEKQMPRALQVDDQMIYVNYGPPWTAKDPEVTEFWRMLDKKKPGKGELGDKRGPAVIFPPVHDAEMFNRFKVLCGLLSGRSAVSGGGRDIASFTGLSVDAILAILSELIAEKAVRKKKTPKVSASDSVTDLLGWRSQDEYELTQKGYGEIEGELFAWSKSKSFRESLGRTIEHRLVKAGRKLR